MQTTGSNVLSSVEMEHSDWLLAVSPVTGVRRCELVAAAGGDAVPGPGPGTGPGPGFC